MSLPPTLVIEDPDDARTLVDRRAGVSPSDDYQPVARGKKTLLGSLRALARREARGLGAYFGWVAALALVLAFCATAYNQERAVKRLERSVARLQESRTGLPPPALREELAKARVASSLVREVAGVSRQPLDAERRSALELEGATLLGANDLERALKQYATLAERLPQEPVFQDIVTILRRKLDCGRECP